MLLGLIMLLPGLCAIGAVSNDPKVLWSYSSGAGLFWLFLAIGAGGIAVIWAAFRALLRSR